MADNENSIQQRAVKFAEKGRAAVSWGVDFASWLGTALLVIAVIFLMLGLLFGAFGCIESIPVIGNAEAQKIGCAANAAMRMVQIGGFLLGFTATAADFGMNRFVFRMEEYIGEGSGIGSAIQISWVLFRDLANLAFIGGLIWAAISLILQTGQQVGKLVVQIIIAALLVNFSYFFAGAIVDASNFTTRIIYQEAIYEHGDVWGFGTPGEEDKYLLTNKFMNATRLGSLYDFQNIENYVSTAGDPWGLLILAVFGLGLFATAAWVFTSIFGLVASRFIVIIILLITSPVGILRFTGIPVVSEWGKWWWSALVSQAVFPPVLFMLMAISFKVIDAMNANLADVAGTKNFADILKAGNPGTSGDLQTNLGIFFTFAVAIGLLYASMKIATNIAKQIPVSAPTTAGVYDFRKKAFGAVGQGVKGGVGALRAIGNLPSFNTANKNFGDRLFRGDVFRDRVGGPLARAFDPVKARDFDVSRGRISTYYEALDDYIAKVKKFGKDSVEAGEAKAAATEKYQLLKEGERNEVNNIDMKKRQAEGKEDAHRDIQKNAAEGSAFIRTQRATQSSQPTDAKTQEALRTIDRDINASDKREAARDKLARQQGLRDMAQDKANAAAALRVARNSKHGVSVLPQEFLAHENVAPQLNLSDAVVIAEDTGVSDEQFNKIADRLSDEVHEQFRASVAAKFRPERKTRGAQNNTNQAT